MAHPGRGSINTRRAYRAVPRRNEVRLLNRQGEELVFVADAHWSAVAFKDAPIVINLQDESRTWKLPISQTGTVKPLTSYRIRVVGDESLWEILSVNRPSDDSWHCVCVRMNEHDGLVP
jgi:hypothetical protein